MECTDTFMKAYYGPKTDDADVCLSRIQRYNSRLGWVTVAFVPVSEETKYTEGDVDGIMMKSERVLVNEALRKARRRLNDG